MSFAYVKPGPKGIAPDRREEAMAMAKPLTPRSERRRSSYGSFEMSLQMTQGLCSWTSKCVKHDGHAGMCWPE